MSMDTATCLHILPGALALLSGLVGLIVGLALALTIWWVIVPLQAEQRLRAREPIEQVLARLERQQIDSKIDEHIECSECWQERHPGMRCALRGSRLCSEHYYRLMLGNATHAGVNQQHPTDILVPASY